MSEQVRDTELLVPDVNEIYETTVIYEDEQAVFSILSKPEASEEPIADPSHTPVEKESSSLTRLQKVGVVVAGFGVAASLGNSLPAAADEANPVNAATVGVAEINAKMSPTAVMKACKKVRVVAHEGVGKGRFSVNSKSWLQSEARNGHNIIEVDGRPAKDTGTGPDGELKEVFVHNGTLNEETKNGTGRVTGHDSAYLENVRYNSGDKLTTDDTMIKFMKQNKNVVIQHEFKNEDGAWTPSKLETWYATYAAAGVIDRINPTSADLGVIRWIEENHPEMFTQYIGLMDYQPNIASAIEVGANQVNVTKTAAFRAYKGSPTYMDAVRTANNKLAAGVAPLEFSVRSDVAGKADTGSVWYRVVTEGGSQIVTQGPNKSNVCAAVRRYAMQNR